MQDNNGLTCAPAARNSWWQEAKCYGLALLAVGLALMVRVALTPVLGELRPYLTLFGGVALAVWLARWKAALVAAIAGFLVANRLLATSEPLLVLHWQILIELAVYLFSAGIIIYLGEHMHRSRERIARDAERVRQSEEEERSQKERLRVTLASIGDAVITTDAGGRVVALNPVAESLTGWSSTDATGRPLEDVFRIVNEQTRATVENPAARALRDGVVVGLANHTVLIAKDGAERPIDDSAAPIRDSAGRIHGCVLVFRDVTERRLADRALMESREMLRITLSSIGDGVIVTDAEARVRSLNQEAGRLTGWTGDEAAGRPLAEVLHIVNEDTGARVENPVEKVFRLGTVVGLANHTVLIAKDGTRTPIDDSAAPIRENDGPLLGAVLVFRDVSEQRELQRAQAHLAAIVEYSGDAIITKSLDGIVQTWNEGASRLFGYTAGEMIGQSITRVIPEHLRHEESEILSRLRAGQPFERLETERVTRDGRRVYVSLSVSPIRDRHGDIIGASKIVHDITDRKMAEEAIRESEKRFRSMADAAPVLIWMSGTDKLRTWFNTQWLEFVGRPMEKEIGNGWADNVHPDDFHHCLETYVTSFDARRPFSMMYRLRRHDGEYRWLLDNGSPRYAPDGEFLGYIGSCIDITERRQAEDSLREADRRKDEFIAVLSHELRNPLAPIAMAVAVMQRRPAADEREQELRNIIERQTSQLARLLDDLLDVNRIRSGKVTLRKERMRLEDSVARAVESVKTRIDAKQQKLVLNLPREPIHLVADPARMAQVIANLLSNASKYTDLGGSITLTAVRAGDTAVLSVRDSGIGIDRDHISRIFDMFTQMGPAVDRSEGGLGVGLALTRTLVELHGGQIEARSDGPGRGSEFVITIPADATPSPASAPQPAAPRRGRGLGRPAQAPHKILVADDNVDSAQMLAEALRQLGHEVRIAHDGIATVEQAKSFDADVAFLDIGMPLMNGYDAATKLREQFGGRIKLVAVTGWGQEADKRRAADASFDHHLTKPVDLRVVEQLIDGVSTNLPAH